MDVEHRILRCDSCQKLVHHSVLSKIGCCHHCGNRRYRSVNIIKEDEMTGLKDKTYDLGLKKFPEVDEFLELFEAVKEEEDE